MTAYDLTRVLDKLDVILDRLDTIETLLILQGADIMTTIDDLTAQVTASTTVEASAIALIQGIAAQLKAAGSDPTKLAALSTQLNACAHALADAVAANTAAAPTAPTARR